MANVSIIIPTYNRAEWLPRAIASAKLAGADAEVIVVDNGSIDETPRICAGISGINYLRLDPNVRQARARNAGIGISTGRFLTFLDDDDQRLPGSLEPQIALLEANPGLGFVYGRVLLGDTKDCTPTGETSPELCPEGDIFWSLLEKNEIPLPGVIARRELIEEVGMFDPEVVGAEDWMLLIRLAERHQVRVVEDPVAICRIFTRSSGQTSSNRIAMCDAAARAQAKGLLLPRALEAPAAQRKEVRQRCLDMLSLTLITQARLDLSDGMPRSALRQFTDALRLNPRRAVTLRAFKWLIWSPWRYRAPTTN
jgi:glycosyltransferase involved in cell wall biosynthesis